MKEMIANRVKNTQPSMTLAITAKAKDLISRGEDVVSFGAGEPDFDTPADICVAAIDAIRNGHTRYTAAAGIMSLREIICNKLKKDNNLDYTPDQVIINSGAKHSLSTALQAIINPGDEVIIPVPYWVSYPEMVRLAEGNPVFVKTDKNNDFKLTLEDLNNALTKKTKAIMLNSPSNPVGAVYSKKELEVIANFAVKNNIIVISDEIYEKLIYENQEHVSIASLNEEIKELTIVVNGMSKAYAMTGWRLGYAAANKDIIQAMNRIQGHAVSHPCSITQYAGVAALQCDDSIIANMVKEYDNRRKYMINRLNNIDELDYIYPEGAFYVMIDISKLFGRNISKKEIQSSLDFAEVLLEDGKVAVIPGIAFGVDNFIRLSYATSMEQIKEGLDRIEKFIK